MRGLIIALWLLIEKVGLVVFEFQAVNILEILQLLCIFSSVISGRLILRRILFLRLLSATALRVN